uniref:Putative secreted peptide n=1 Tax=Anopheles braziliensis TaxID=58242 RepID=A0A2M3ZS46_9DIPT
MFISLIFELPRSCLPPLHTTVTFFWLVLMLCCLCSGVETSRVLLPFVVVVVVAEPVLDVSIFAAASGFALSVCSFGSELVGDSALCTWALFCGK